MNNQYLAYRIDSVTIRNNKVVNTWIVRGQDNKTYDWPELAEFSSFETASDYIFDTLKPTEKQFVYGPDGYGIKDYRLMKDTGGTVTTSLATAIKEYKNVSPHQVWIDCSYGDDLGQLVRIRQVRLARLYQDWCGECEFCPPNKARLFTLNMWIETINKYIYIIDGVEFGYFIKEAEKNWDFSYEEEEED